MNINNLNTFNKTDILLVMISYKKQIFTEYDTINGS